MTKTTEPQGMKNLPQQSSNSNSTHSSSCCSSSSPLSSSPNIQFQQQCHKDCFFQNLTMKSSPKRKRNPLSDCTNTSSSSSVPPKSTKFKPSFSSPMFKNLSTIYASNPSSSSSPSLLTPPLPNKFPTPETVDLKDSGNISITYGRRYSSNKRNGKEKEVDIPTNSVPSKRKDKDAVILANSEPSKFQQQCQKDPNSIQNLTMESERKRKLTRRTPFSDCTNTSSSVPPKSTKYKSSYSYFFKFFPTTLTSTTDAVAVNLDDAANPSSSPSTSLSTPLPKKPSTPEIDDLEASGISIVYGRRYSSNKRKDKEKEAVFPTSSSVPIKTKDKVKDTVISTSSMSMDTWKEVAIPGSSTSIKRKDKEKEAVIPPSSVPIKRKDKENEMVFHANSAPIKRKDKGKDIVTSESSNFMDTWAKAVISESSTSFKRKDKGEEYDIPSSTTSILKASNTREKSDGLERANPSKAKASSAPCIKKHHVNSSKSGVLIKDHPDLQDYIKEQNAHFKEIDDFELLVEEVDIDT